jgi:hypothetical protein
MPELVAALVAAVSVNTCDPPGVVLPDAGIAVTPAGKPDSVTTTADENPFTAATETVTVCVAPPAASITVGPAEIVKSRTAAVPPLHPNTLSAIQPITTSQQPATHPPPTLRLDPHQFIRHRLPSSNDVSDQRTASSQYLGNPADANSNVAVELYAPIIRRQ